MPQRPVVYYDGGCPVCAREIASYRQRPGGGALFAEIWRGMPRLRWLGRLLAIPPFGAVAELAYRIFLRVRGLWR